MVEGSTFGAWGFEGWGFWFVSVSLCRGLGAGAWLSARLGLRLFSLSFGSLFWVFLSPYGCALAHGRHARAHNSDMTDATGTTGTTDGTDETDISYAFSHTRAVHTSSLRVCTYAPTTSRIKFQLRSLKVLVRAVVRFHRGKNPLEENLILLRVKNGFRVAG